MTRVVVSGAAGRMGRRIIELVLHDSALLLVGAIEAPSHASLGQRASALSGDAPTDPDVMVTAGLPDGVAADVAIDFSAPEQSVRLADAAARAGCGLVVGTTGFTPEQREAVMRASAKVPVLTAPNFALGMNVVFRIAAEAARLLSEGYDIEVVESHHRFKKDAPSGTALRLAESVAKATGRRLEEDAVHGRRGLTGERRPGEIGIHALRRGDIVGEHTVTFTSLGETVELTHRAHSRDAFARGAVHAAKWLAGKPAGTYTFEQVLGI